MSESLDPRKEPPDRKGPGAESNEQKEAHGKMPDGSIALERAAGKSSDGKIASVSELTPVENFLRRIANAAGGEYRAGMDTARIVKQQGNYPATVARLKFSVEGVKVSVPQSAQAEHSADEFAATEFEEAQIKAAMGTARFYEMKPAVIRADRPLPGKNTRQIEEARAKGSGHYFEFVSAEKRPGHDDRNGRLIDLVQIRIDKEGGDKDYICYTFWEDEVWRRVEPSLLPLWNAHRLKGAGVVFIHEGAKAAAHCQRLTDGEDREARDAHPWKRWLFGPDAVHVGWIGGALNPGRTDWKALARAGVRRAIVVPDNDDEGKSAVNTIADLTGISLEAVMFMPRGKDDNGWKKGFDLADPLTKGPPDWPPFESVCEPCSWIARPIFNDKGKVAGGYLTEAAKREWVYLRDVELIVHRKHKRIEHTPQAFDRAFKGYCGGVKEPSSLIMAADAKAAATWTYRPGGGEFVALPGGGNAFNRFVPSHVRPEKGDAGPWLEFLDYLVPDPDDRRNLMRWMATLIARPEVRMTWGVLAISETQGTGKSTLSDCVLKPLIGAHNTGEPRNEDIKSQFNSWASRKRLVIVREIYQERSWQVYHSMKDLTADNSISINEKNRPAVTVENWCHVFASSNKESALRMEDTDRRWFFPAITEEPWPGENFAEFRAWLKAGGLSIIAHWAEAYGEYVEAGENAPMSLRKAGIIEASRSGIERWLLEWARGAVEKPEPEPDDDTKSDDDKKPEPWLEPCVSLNLVLARTREEARRTGKHLTDKQVRKMLALAGFVPDPVEERRTRDKLRDDRDTKHTILGTAGFWSDLDAALAAGEKRKTFIEGRLRPAPEAGM